MSEPFLSAKLRIGRAKELLSILKESARAFAESDPYVFLEELDYAGLNKVYKCRLTRHTPPQFDFLIVEAVEHLRASLDHLGYAAAVLGGHSNPKRCHFPIANTPTMLETDVIGRGNCKELPPDILALFRSLQPYKGGNGGAVWVLNQLCNIGKHRFLTSVGFESFYADVKLDQLPPGSTVFPHIWDSEKHEISYFSVPVGIEAQYNFEVAFFIAFRPFGPLAGQPVLPHLFAIAEDVTRIVKQTEIVARRIGLIPV